MISVVTSSIAVKSLSSLIIVADKDLANLLMELGRGDDIDSDSILSTQTPATSQEAEDGRTDNGKSYKSVVNKPLLYLYG